MKLFWCWHVNWSDVAPLELPLSSTRSPARPELVRKGGWMSDLNIKISVNNLSSGWMSRRGHTCCHSLPKSFGVVNHRDEVTQCAGANCREGRSYIRVTLTTKQPWPSVYIWAIWTSCYLLLRSLTTRLPPYPGARQATTKFFKLNYSTDLGNVAQGGKSLNDTDCRSTRLSAIQVVGMWKNYNQ